MCRCRYPLLGAVLAMCLGAAPPVGAAAATPLDLTLPAGPLRAARTKEIPRAMPVSSRMLVTFAWPEEGREPEAQLDRTLVALPTALPTAAQPLIFDLTPLPCPGGRQPRWPSFGAMPGTELVMAAHQGYPQRLLCGP